MKRLPFVLLLLSIWIPASLQTATAQRPDAPTYAMPGPYDVGVVETILEDAERPLTVTVWYPATAPDDAEPTTYALPPLRFTRNGIADAPPDTTAAPYPLVVFSHGSGGYRFQSLWLVEHLASHGFVVMAPDHPTNTVLDGLNDEEAYGQNLPLNYAYRPDDLRRVIDYAEAATAAAGPLSSLIDMDRVAAAGHSFGGYTALAVGGATLNTDQLAMTCASTPDPERFATACFIAEEADRIAAVRGFDATPEGAWPTQSDPRVDAVIALAPWNNPILDAASLADNTTPTLIIVGTNDTVTPADRDSIPTFNSLINAPRALATLELAGHYIFVDQCAPLAIQFGFFDSCSDDVWDMQRAHDLSNHLITAFLLDTFQGDADAAAALEPANVDFPGVDYQRIDAEPVAQLTPRVIERIPHDTSAFTQGLLLHDGGFYESTGRYGQSTLRRVDRATGEVREQLALSDDYFAEGLALVDDRLIQLTWRESTAFVYNAETFEQIGTFTYEGEGWGLCYDGAYLYMSDGTAVIDQRDPDTFELIQSFQVNNAGEPVVYLNELECVGDDIYANIWLTDQIVRFDKTTGAVNAVINAAGLLSDEETVSADVLNGIAHDPATGRFFITGKYWPWLFEVTFEPAL
ncbi:MAG: glutaminyl-peptide cyclotransferase [Chloroflexota bacterium]